jgi:hypothetical protein
MAEASAHDGRWGRMSYDPEKWYYDYKPTDEARR